MMTTARVLRPYVASMRRLHDAFDRRGLRTHDRNDAICRNEVAESYVDEFDFHPKSLSLLRWSLNVLYLLAEFLDLAFHIDDISCSLRAVRL